MFLAPVGLGLVIIAAFAYAIYLCWRDFSEFWR